MTAAVWTDERIREAFIYDGGEAEYHDPISGAQTQRQVAGSIFDAWLAAHDAALLVTAPTPPADHVRAAVEAERQRAAAHAREGYRASENCDDIAKRILSGEPAAEEIPGRVWSPPADDVREALARALRGEMSPGAIPWEMVQDVYLGSADRLLAAFEVRPRGTVTDAERPYSEAVDVEHGAWETDDIEERAHDLLAVVARRREEGR